MTQFSNKFKKPCFWPILGAKKFFLENPALSRTTSYGLLAPWQNLEKVNDTNQRKRLDIRTEGRTEIRKINIFERRYFYFVNISYIFCIFA